MVCGGSPLAGDENSTEPATSLPPETCTSPGGRCVLGYASLYPRPLALTTRPAAHKSSIRSRTRIGDR